LLLGFRSSLLETIVDTVKYQFYKVLQVHWDFSFVVWRFFTLFLLNKVLNISFEFIKEGLKVIIGSKVKDKLYDRLHFFLVQSADIMLFQTFLSELLINFFFDIVPIGFKMKDKAFFQLVSGHAINLDIQICTDVRV
jgi:hypothetical protein